MSNIIDSIQLSGSSYDVRDKSATTVVEITQSDYDNLPSSAKTSNILYIITDGSVDYITSGQCQTQIDNSISGKQDTLVSGTNIKTINNESLLGSGNIDIQGGGGGKAVTGGTNISVTTGETADTISCTLPITANNYKSLTFNTSRNPSQVLYASAFGDYTTASGKGSFAIGKDTTASGNYSFVGGRNSSQAKGSDSFSFGDGTVTNKNASVAFGRSITTNNECEFSCGKLNKSVSASTTFGNSGNTLFSVGNGTSTYHNAFEVKQNGDIYITLNDQDVKLQDQLGGSSITIDPSLDSGSTNAVANSAITTAIDSKANKTAAYGSTTWGETNNKEYVQFTKVSGIRDTARYISKINGKTVWGTTNINACVNWELVETSAITTSVTSSSTDAQVPSAKAVNDKLGGLSLVKLTQSEYDALATKDSNTLYVIVN